MIVFVNTKECSLSKITGISVILDTHSGIHTYKQKKRRVYPTLFNIQLSPT
jgi:hypothetical protein